MSNLEDVLSAVIAERQRQDTKWGVQDRSIIEWLAILAEEFGEVSDEVVEVHFGRKVDIADYRQEMIQVAAVAVAAVECLDRRLANGEKRRAERQSPKVDALRWQWASDAYHH